MNQDQGQFSENIERGIQFLMRSIKDGGRFGSTQATILSLKALVCYSKISGGVSGQGKFTLVVDDEEVSTIEFGQPQDPTPKIDFSNDV